MANFYLNINDINVFPATNKPGELQSRLNTEYNLTNIVNRLVNKKSFVITSNSAIKEINVETEFEFNILGYYVKITNLKSLVDNFNGSDKIYASIFLIDNKSGKDETSNGIPVFRELSGGEEETGVLDADGNEIKLYTSIIFTSTKDTDQIINPQKVDVADDTSAVTNEPNETLCILTKINNEWVVPRDSRIQFNQWVFDVIDDGDFTDIDKTFYK